MPVKSPQDLIADEINALEDSVQAAQDCLSRIRALGEQVDIDAKERQELTVMGDKVQKSLTTTERRAKRLHRGLQDCAKANNLSVSGGPGREKPD